MFKYIHIINKHVYVYFKYFAFNFLIIKTQLKIGLKDERFYFEKQYFESSLKLFTISYNYVIKWRRYHKTGKHTTSESHE